MSKQNTILDDIGQAITDLGTMIGGQFKAADKRFDAVEKVQKEQGVMLKKQGVLLEDMTYKFDKNIDLLTKQMNVKVKVDDHEKRIGDLETSQKTIKSAVTLHSQQLAVK